jgi:SAM-dependent methyltransferase
MIENSKERFTNRVDDYVKYRPSYPPTVVDFVHEHGVSKNAEIADIGAGTGISTKLFLDAGHSVCAVEPNEAMRTACDRWLGGDAGYGSIAGNAEDTLLSDASVDLVVAAQAFHWFDVDLAKKEFKRLLRGDKMVALFWNSRSLDGTQFLVHYEALLRRFGTDYKQVAERHSGDEVIEEWFGKDKVTTARFPNAQSLDFEGLKGRLLSSSYAPKEGHPQYEPMLLALRQLFNAQQRDGLVGFDYETRVYLGRLS